MPFAHVITLLAVAPLVAATGSATVPASNAPIAAPAGTVSVLPDSPGFALQQPDAGNGVEAGDQPAAAATPQAAKKHATTIQPGQSAAPLTAGDKFAIGVVKQVTLGAFASWNVSAGYKHLLDNRPHYGTDRAGFGERLGASALRDTSQSILYYGVYSNLFKEDPRYYVLGPQHKFVNRALYAASRVVITRKDNGGTTGNYALVAAIFSASALTNAYYPTRDVSASNTITGALTALAVRAGTQQLREFSGDIKRALHLKQ